METIKSASNIAIERATFQEKNMKVEVSNNPLALDNDFTYGDFENRQHSSKVYCKLSNWFSDRTKRISAF